MLLKKTISFTEFKESFLKIHLSHLENSRLAFNVFCLNVVYKNNLDIFINRISTPFDEKYISLNINDEKIENM